jgi:riboflavin synthase
MFTGIVEAVGAVTSVSSSSHGTRLAIDLGAIATGIALGDSISVSGCCLTVAAVNGSVAEFDVSSETLRKTTLGSWRSGTHVNLERALAVGARLGGHFVTGHVDGVGVIEERVRETGSERFTVRLPADGSVRAVEKGSIAIDGISLTSWDCRDLRLSAAIIPYTLEHTTLGGARVGDTVNLEQDVIGRWVAALMAPTL